MRFWKIFIFVSCLFLSYSLRAQDRTAPQDIVQGGTYNFGQVALGSTILRSEIIDNTGPGTQYVTWAQPNAPFSVLGSQGTAIPPGTEDTVVMAFQPTLPGYDSETLQVYV